MTYQQTQANQFIKEYGKGIAIALVCLAIVLFIVNSNFVDCNTSALLKAFCFK